MNNEKKAPVLTLAHLAPYLPYGLNVISKVTEYTYKVLGLSNDELMIVENDMFSGWCAISNFKPILRPLSEYKDINSKSMNDLNTDLEIQMEICDLANKKISFHSFSYGTAKECFANHIDIFGLIEKGLAIDINSIEGKETNNG